ncbi:MAG TPA: glycosyltransferase family 4 protein [Bryobacteraceae bacterium]
MRLLFLDQFSDLGGGQRMLLELLAGVRERRWHATVGLPGSGEMFGRVEDLGFRTARIECGAYSSGAKSLRDVGRFVGGAPRLVRDIRSLERQAKPDVVYVNGPRLLPAAAMAGLRAPVIFHAHIALSGAARRLTGMSLRRLNAQTIAVCRMVADCWRPFGKTSVIFNGVPGPECVSRDAREGPPRVGCIGRISREKGQLEFLRAAAQVYRAIPECRFAIVGAALFADAAAEEYEQEVRAAAAGLPVKFCGWTSDVYGALAGLDVLLVPSVWAEPNPRVILEAFAAGVPVIAFRAGGIPEIVQDGRTGFLCEDAESMARIVVELLRDPARRASVAAAARESWKCNFTAERYRRQVLEAIEAAARA